VARRKVEVFGLSFLDCICCGFGAAILLFMLLNAAKRAEAHRESTPRRAEVDRIAEEVREGRERLVRLRNSIRAASDEAAAAEGLSARLIETLRQAQVELASHQETTTAKRAHLDKLKADLRSLEEGARRLSGGAPSEDTPGDKTRSFVGDGDRQYLTGLKVGGRRILFLVDASASMLADTIVNAVRRRHMPADVKTRAEKWQQAVKTVDWLSTQVPRDARFQVYLFNTRAKAAIPGTDGVWLDGRDRKVMDDAVAKVRAAVPEGGTSLHHAFLAAKVMEPSPDNVILVTDGLPTQGLAAPRAHTISSPDRLKLLERAVDDLPRGVPINVILLPMEGDPLAAPAFWKLALATRGSLITPSRDWP
jgi:hypothetical protein